MFDQLPVNDLHLDSVVIYGAAYHTNRDTPHNEVNPGLGLRLKNGDSNVFYALGAYKNSNWRNSVYAGIGKEYWRFGPLSIGALAGVITGYNKFVLPVILPEVALHYGSVAIAANFIPPTPWNPGVLGFSVIKRF